MLLDSHQKSFRVYDSPYALLPKLPLILGFSVGREGMFSPY